VPEVVKVKEKPSQANATLIEGEFFATPEPRVRLGDVSPQNAEGISDPSPATPLDRAGAGK